jgi:shikimate kinase
MKTEGPANIFLIGYRCTGKTSVGRRLAALTERRFVDTDDCLTGEFGDTIAAFVAAHGWKAFRQQEALILARVCGESGLVVATGGGIVLTPENVTIMKNSGLVVWLTAPPATIARRMASDPLSRESRPKLTEMPGGQEIERTLAERLPLYRRAMDFSIDTDDMAVEDICRQIMAAAIGRGE